MYSLHTPLVELLTRYVSPIIARSILTRALREHGLEGVDLDASTLKALAPRIEAAVKLFVEPADYEAFRAGLTGLIGDVPGKESVTLHIKSSESLRVVERWELKPVERSSRSGEGVNQIRSFGFRCRRRQPSVCWWAGHRYGVMPYRAPPNARRRSASVCRSASCTR
jgi:hypothetical protein